MCAALVLASVVNGEFIRIHNEDTGHFENQSIDTIERRAGAKMPVIRIGDFPKENAPSEGVTDSLRISICADDHLWKFDSNLSADEWFFDSKALKAELKDKDMDHYLRVRDKATLLAHLAKFDAWGLKARFSTNNDDCSMVSVGFSHPAVPAYNLPNQDHISVDPRDNPYLDFFKWPQDAKEERFNPQWVPSLIWGLEKSEKGRVSTDAQRWEHLRFDLETMSNTSAVIKNVEYNGDMTQLSAEDQSILFNADHTPVFLIGQTPGVGSKPEYGFLKAVTKPVHLDDLSQTAFTTRGMNNPTYLKAEEETFEFTKFFNVDPGLNEDYKDSLGKNKMTLIYLKGAEKAKFDNSSGMMEEAWTIFANRRFAQAKVLSRAFH